MAAALGALIMGETTSEIDYFETNRRRTRYREFRPGLSHGQRHGGERLQAGDRSAAQAGGDALEQGGSPGGAEPASPVAQRPLGRHLAPYTASPNFRLNLGAHPFCGYWLCRLVAVC